VGPSQNFPDINTAFNTIARKRIGTSGYVTFKLATGTFQAISVGHPDGDRITVRGTMIAANPLWSDFAATGNSSTQRAQDATYNLNMLRAKFGTEIQSGTGGTIFGVQNTGSGQLTFQDLLKYLRRLLTNSGVSKIEIGIIDRQFGRKPAGHHASERRMTKSASELCSGSPDDGRKAEGKRIPRSGCLRRIRPSAPQTSPECKSILG